MVKKIKIVHIITSLEIGGCQRVLYDLVTGLHNTDYEQVIVCFREGPYRAFFEEVGITPLRVHGFFSLYDPIFFFRLYRLLSQINADLVHSMLWSANVSSRFVGIFLRTRLITTYHNTSDQNGLLKNVIDACSLRLYRSTIVAVSEHIRRSLAHLVPDAQRSSVSVIYNGINSEHVRYLATTRMPTGIPFLCSKKAFVIGAVGRLVGVKRYSLLIESVELLVKKYPEVYLIIVGSGPEEKKLRNMITQKKLEKNVNLVVGERAYGYYQLFDCFVQTSYQEGISIALLEALALGLPCLVVDKENAHPVIVDEYNGLIISHDTPFQCMKSIEKLIQSEKKRYKLSRNGMASIRSHFSADRMCKKYDILFKE